MIIKITPQEYALMKSYIEKHCGIHLSDGKEYLIETRLSDLVFEFGCKTFYDFHSEAIKSMDGKIRDRVVDAMTTNETFWFRDDNCWNYLESDIVPKLVDLAAAGKRIRIWSAAASTGQEAYSMIMLIEEQAQKRGLPNAPSQFEITGTDISSSALFLAISGRYDVLSMGRGISDERKEKYFKKDNRIWSLDDRLRKRVKFKRFNLQDAFDSLGMFDLVLCRYVAIYFSVDLKKKLYSKIARQTKTGGNLILGATETIRGLNDDFEIVMSKNTIINRKKG